MSLPQSNRTGLPYTKSNQVMLELGRWLPYVMADQVRLVRFPARAKWVFFSKHPDLF